MKIASKTLIEIIKDFQVSGLEIDTETFIEWLGINLNDKDFDKVGQVIYEIG